MTATAEREQVDLRTRIEHAVDSKSVPFAAWLYRRTHGRIARLYHRDVLLLTTTGRRSGLDRTVILQFFPDGDDLILVAANSGMPNDPAWYLNLLATPRARVEIGGETVEVTAERLGAAETAVMWARVLEVAPDYERFTDRTDRELPLVRLTPVTADERTTDVPAVDDRASPSSGRWVSPRSGRRRWCG